MLATAAMVLVSSFQASGAPLDVRLTINICKITPRFAFAAVQTKKTKSGAVYAIGKQETVGKLVQSLLENKQLTILASSRKRVVAGNSTSMSYHPAGTEKSTYEVALEKRGLLLGIELTASTPPDTKLKVDLKADEALLMIQEAAGGYPRRLVIVAPDPV